jgi:hypothetical protein
MTYAARLVLADAEDAANQLADRANARWRAPWVASVILIRTVGEVLERVDEPTGRAAFREASRAAYGRLFVDRPPIYWQFIRDERAHIIGSYGFAIRQIVEMEQASRGRRGGRRPSPGPAYPHVALGRGPFAGRTPHNVLLEALTFWRTYLDAIDVDALHRSA